MRKLLGILFASIFILVGCLGYLRVSKAIRYNNLDFENMGYSLMNTADSERMEERRRMLDKYAEAKNNHHVEALPDHYLYYYEKMNSEDQQIYQELYSAMKQHGTSTRISVTDMDTIERVFQYIILDNPELFYIENLEAETITIAKIKSMMTIRTIENMDEVEQTSAQKKIDEFKANFIGQISESMSEEAKAESAFTYVVEELEYVVGSPYNQSLYSAALGQTVCMGYTAAFKYLCDQMDIPCISVIGKLEGGDHAWNMVYLDHIWYQVDCTQGDALVTYPPKVDYSWFQRKSEDMAKTHVLREPELLPVCR